MQEIIEGIRKGLLDIKRRKKGFVDLIDSRTKYTYRHVHNFLKNPEYNVTMDFIQEMQKFIEEEDN